MLLVSLLLNPAWGGLRPSRPLVGLDVSLSWGRGADTTAWVAAQRLARQLAGDSLLLVGNTVRPGVPPPTPGDTMARVLDAADRAQLAGRPLTFITDGEIREDTSRLRERLPVGSRIEVVAPVRRPDVAITALDAPSAAVAGDSVILNVRVASALEAPPAVELVASVDDRVVAQRQLGPFRGWESRTESLVLRLPAGPAEARVSVILSAAGDGESRNDSAARTIHRGQRITMLAVSTAPDFDFREIVRVMRGALPVPAAARFRIARDRWVDDAGRSVTEAQLRVELAQAHVVVLHGDTAHFGNPRTAVHGALALIPSPADGTEWHMLAAPSSPLTAILGTLPFDSLPPVAVGQPPAVGTPLIELRAAGERRRTGATLEEGDRRVIVAPIRGTARWSLRGGAASDAFASFWGALIAALADRPGGGIRTSIAEISLAELHPRPPLPESWAGEGGSRPLRRAPLRSAAWPYALIIVLLCAEWVLRRRAGLR